MKTSSILIGAVLLSLLPRTATAATALGNWTIHCTRCHASDGSGKTKYGDKMRLKDYTKPEEQKSFTDAYALEATRDGAKDASGKKVMPGYADKLSEEEIRDLVAYVRSFEKKP